MTTRQQAPARHTAGLRSAARWAVHHGVPRLLVRRGMRTGDLQSQLLGDPATWRDPYDFHERVRSRGPLVAGRFSLLSASHDVVRHVLSSADFGVETTDDLLPPWMRRLTAWTAHGRPVHPVEPPSMLAVDPPEHTRYRRLVSTVFTARAVEGLRARVQEIADALLDDLPRHGPVVDLVERYALRLPVEVIADILGVPPERRQEVRAFEAGIARSLEAAAPWRQFRTVEAALRGFDSWIGRHLEELRRAPGEDLLSRLVTVTHEGAHLSDRELRATAGLLMAAGFETTVNLLGSATQLLLADPQQLATVRADPARWPDAVEEALRVESPVQITARLALRDTTLARTAVPRGARVVVLLGAANRDPAVFTDPARFDVLRHNAREHLAFSAGRHFCLGAALARLEGEVGLRSLFERYPALALEPGGSRTATRVLRGWERLPVRLG